MITSNQADPEVLQTTGNVKKNNNMVVVRQKIELGIYQYIINT